MERITFCFVHPGMDIRSLIFGNEALNSLTSVKQATDTTAKAAEPLYQRFVRYLEDAHRDGVIGDGRFAVAMGKARKLQRFLTIKCLSTITADEFTIMPPKFRTAS